MWVLDTFVFTLSISSVYCNTWCQWGTFGLACDKICPEHCRPRADKTTVHCHIDSGICSSGCIPGWHGDKCNKTCSKTCINNTCNIQDGACTIGCTDVNKGIFCQEETKGTEVNEHTTDPSRNEEHKPLLTERTLDELVIAVFLIIPLLLGILVLLSCVLYRHRNRNRKQDSSKGTPTDDTQRLTSTTEMDFSTMED